MKQALSCSHVQRMDLFVPSFESWMTSINEGSPVLSELAFGLAAVYTLRMKDFRHWRLSKSSEPVMQ